jgi:hypothetical protein
VSTFEFGAGLLVLAAVVGVVDDRTLRLPRPGGVAARFLPEITPSGMRCRLLPISAATPRIPISASPAEQGAAPGPTARHPCICERLRWPVARLWGAAYRGDRAGGARLYKLPCSISSSAPAMTLSGIELSANVQVFGRRR